MLFVNYPKCTTCQKAKKWLDANGISYTDRNIKEERPTEAELKEWIKISGLPVKRFFNTSGMLVKRPLLVSGETVLVGFKEEQWNAIIESRD